MNLTDEQIAVRDAIADPTAPSTRCDARAGAGKTSTIFQGLAAQRFPEKDQLLVAFSRRDKDTFQQRLDAVDDKDTQAKTLNGLGHGIWMRYTRSRITLEGQKVGNLTSEATKKYPEFSEQWNDIRQLVATAKTNGLVHTSAPGTPIPMTADTPEAWEDLCYVVGCAAHPDIINLARDILLDSTRMAFNGQIDFDDQVYMPTCWPVNIPKRDLIIVDEAQDLNPLQHKLLSKCRPNRLISVGDPYQAIYGWRGAMADSLDRFQEAYNQQVLYMTTCFRCSDAVIKRAQSIVSDIKARPGAPAGTVSTPESWAEGDLQRNDVIICRNNAPLVKMAFKLLAEGIPIEFPGQDFGKMIINLIKNVSGAKGRDPDLDMKMPEFMERLKNWEDTECATATLKGRFDRIDQIKDKAESVRVLGVYAQDLRDLINNVHKIFNANGRGVTLTTIHKAKGREWKRVWFMDSGLIPNRFALKSAEIPGKEWVLQQEMNMKYVAITRAEQDLMFVSSEGYQTNVELAPGLDEVETQERTQADD